MFIPSKMKRILLTACAALLATSCMMDKKPGVPAGPGEGKVAVTFAVEVPAAVPVQTRAAYGDCDVLNMDVLVFDRDGKFLERAGTDQVSGDGAAKSFTVRVDPSAERRIFMVIANARSAAGADRVDMSVLTPGVSETDVLAALKTLPLTGGRTDEILPLVMYGHGELPRIDGTAGPLNVSLLRAEACIQVKTALPTADNGLADFTLQRATLSSAAASGMVAGAGPDLDKINTPAGLTYVDYWTSATDDTGWSVGTNPVLYAYERYSRYSTSDYYTSVLVQASWKRSQYFYRILMHGESPSLLYNLVRNHRYTVTIAKVEGPGWPTAALAMANPPANIGNTIMEVQITDASDDLFDIVADGTYMLGLTCNMQEHWGRSDPAEDIRIPRFLKATHPSASTLLTAKVNSSNVTGVAFAPASGVTDGYFDLVYRMNPDNVTDLYALSMTIRCGNFERKIGFYCEETKFSGGLDNTDDKDADSYAFMVANEHTPKPWRVWIPASKTMRLSPSASAGDFTPAGNGDNSAWGYSLIESRTSERAYLHVPSSTNSCIGEDLMLTDGNGSVRRITIGKHD